MKSVADELSGLVDREKIRHCLARLCRGLDRRDAALVSESYWPGAKDDHGVSVGTAEEFLAWVVPGSPAMIVTLHTLGQSLIELSGHTAVVETHVTAYHRVAMNGPEHDIFLGGRYLDRMEKREQEWRITHRKLIYDWLKDLGASTDWSKGAFGMPFVSEQSVGLARGDYSEKLFK